MLNKDVIIGNIFKICIIVSSFAIITISCNKSSAKLRTTGLDGIEFSVKPFDDSLLPSYESQLKQLKPTEGMGRVLNLPKIKDFNTNPDYPSNIKTRFDIYTRKTKTKGLIFDHKYRPEDEFYDCVDCDPSKPYPFSFKSLVSVGFDPNKTTVIMIPGYRTENQVDWMDSMVWDWLNAADVNLILVTWASANHGFYEKAAANIPYVSRQITILLHYLSQISGIDMTHDPDFMESIHLVGHSCGSHIAAFVGRDFSGLLGRITGLDPAGPIFDKFEPEFRLNRKNAKLVDVYHSNMGILDRRVLACAIYRDQYNSVLPFCNSLPNQGRNANPALPGAFMGLVGDIGDINFYLNDGHMQPGCTDWSNMCDHSRVVEMLSDSLKYEYFLRERYQNNNNYSRVLESSRTDTEMGNLEDKLKSFRPLAFKANDYATFREGINFNENTCKQLRRDPSNTIATHTNNSLALCSIPVDFVTPPREYRRQLRLEHNLTMLLDDWSINDLQAAKFFMATAPQRPLLGDHLLLKLKIGSQLDWDQSCALSAFVYFSNKPTEVLKAATLQSPNPGDVITIPIRPDFSLQLRSLVDKLSDGRGKMGEKLVRFEDSLRKYLFPKTIFFTARRKFLTMSSNSKNDNYEGGSSNKWQRARDRSQRQQRTRTRNRKVMMSDFIEKSSDGRQRLMANSESKCRLDFSYVAIQPIWENNSNFYGIFTTNNSLVEPYELLDSSEFQIDDSRYALRVQPYSHKFLHLDQIVVDNLSASSNPKDDTDSER